MGREYDGISRTTFIIDKKGIIEDIIEKVNTKEHTSQILKEALSREKNRSGQCFIVQNDISKMASI